jgi:hypothetical protein
MLPLLLALNTANAQSSPVQWTWAEGKVRTWYVESLVLVPSPWMLGVWGTQGLGRTGKVRLSMVMSCTAVDANETTWDLSCEVRDAAIVAASVSGEDPAVIEAVAQHYAEGLTRSELQLVMGKDGTLRNVDLEGMSKADPLEAQGQEWTRQLIRRALSGFDVSSPPLGEPTWVQRDSPWSDSPYGGSAPGTLRLMHEMATVEDQHTIRSVGRGALTLPIAGSTAPDALTAGGGTWSMRVSAIARFDETEGAMVERSWGLLAEAGASVGVITGQPYLLGGYMRLVGADEDAPDCGESGLWVDHWSSSHSDLALNLVKSQEGRLYHEAGFRSEPYVWASVGPTWHLQHLRENVEGLSVTAGVRLPLALSVGGGIQADRQTSLRYLGWPLIERQAFAGVWYESNYVLSPRVGVLGGAIAREFPGRPEGVVYSPFVALDLSLLWRARDDSWLGLHARAPVEVGHLVVTDSVGNELWLDNTSLVVSLAWTQKLSGRGKSSKVHRASVNEGLGQDLLEASIPQAELLSSPTE